MKVLDCFLDNRFGGPQRRTSSVAGRLREHNVETIFLFNERSKGNIPVKGFKCFLIKYIQCITRSSTLINLFLFCVLFPVNLYKIYKIIKLENINIVDTNGIINFVPVLAAKLNRARVIWHLNDTVTPRIVRKFFLPLVRLFADRIILQGERIGQYYFGNNTTFWNKSVILHAPVDLNKFNPGLVDAQNREILRAEFNISTDDLVIGAVGNINRAKGYEHFIEAAEIIKQNVGKFKFLIFGSKLETKKDYWQSLQDLVHDLNIRDDIVFTGFRDDISEILSIIDVFVNSSVSESLPNAVLEAMAMKVPVVATNVGAVAEQVINGKTGIVVEPRRPDLLAEAILKIANLPKHTLEKMTNEGRRRVEEIFSLHIIARRYHDIYKKILGD